MYQNPGTLHAWKFLYIERGASKWETGMANIMKNPDTRVDGQISQLEATRITGK